jgi:hypothetical protein
VQKARLEDRIREVMNSSLSTREAKEYLVAQITAEAQREGISLSDVERKMLYFSETGWTLPEIMEVNEQFDQDYDQDEYEKKLRNSSEVPPSESARRILRSITAGRMPYVN